jgi:hypothetical protein
MQKRNRRQQLVVRFPEGEVNLDEEGGVWVSVNLLAPKDDSEYEEHPMRWNAEFWSHRWSDIYETLMERCPFEVQKLGEFIPEKVSRFGQEVPGITYGQVGERVYPPKGTKVKISDGQVTLKLPDGTKAAGVAYLQVRNLRRTGIDIYASPPEKRYIVEGSRNDPIRSRLMPGDLLLIRSGVGSLGRCVVVPEGLELMNVSQHISRIVLEGIKSEWVAMFLQSCYGAGQMSRWLSGATGQVEIDFKEIRRLLIPVPDQKIQEEIAHQYWRMADYHYEAMKARERGDEVRAERILKIALGMLEVLLVQVERIVDGEAKEVIPLMPENIPSKLKQFLEDEYRKIGELHEELERESVSFDFDRQNLLGIPLERHEEVVKEAERLLRLLDSLRGDLVEAGKARAKSHQPS